LTTNVAISMCFPSRTTEQAIASMQISRARTSSLLLLFIASLVGLIPLSGCGSGSSNGEGQSTDPSNSGAAATHTLGGSVVGLTSGASVILLDNGGSALTASANGAFTFPTALASGASYAITVGTRPAGQTCSVAGGTGTIGSANVANVVVTCSDQAYPLGGSVSGLDGSGLVLANGSSTISVSAGAMSFTLPTPVAYTSSYQVTVQTQPSGEACSVTHGSGAMPASAVTNVSVTCTQQPFTLGGTITGLGSNTGLVLVNGTATLNVQAGSTGFTMPTSVNYGSTYAVVVQSAPAGLTCTASNASGTMPATNVTNVAIACSDQSYMLGGAISGLTSSGLVLANGTDTINVTSGATSFQMDQSVAYAGAYDVVVQTQPAGLTCTVANGSGTMGTAPVTNVAVTCAPNTYTVGGTITGLGSASGLVLTNGSDTLAVLANATTFTMPTGVASGSTYDVTVQTNPTALFCSVTNGSGTVGSADVTDVVVSCGPAESVLHSFAGGTTDGGEPEGSLIQGSDGNFYGLTVVGGANDVGLVFKVTPSGAETVLYSFAGGTSDGANPWGSLIQASDGNFYGMAEIGGANGCGVVFKITPAGAETVLYSFAGGTTDGAYPFGSLTQGSDGNLYGMTPSGGANGDGVVFKITLSGTETVLYSFTGGTADGSLPYGSLIQASDGNFYGMTVSGGANGRGTVFKVTASGTETLLHSFAGATTDGAGPGGSLIQVSNGTFYGMTPSGGANGDGVVFKITPSGAETVLYSFAGGTTDGASPTGSLIQASDGNLYGVAQNGGASAKGAIFAITPSGAETVLYSFAGGATDGANPEGNLIQTSDGNFYGMTVTGGASNDGTVFEFK
jgi:uncharacterized repeat protein (TIGR03803 family)